MIEEKKQVELLAMNEVMTYFLIDECGAFIWTMTHQMANGKIPESECSAINEDIANITEIQVFVISNLTRFGIDPESAKDRDGGEYWKWFKFYDDWKKNLSNETWNKISDLLEANLPIEKYLPEGSWRD